MTSVAARPAARLPILEGILPLDPSRIPCEARRGDTGGTGDPRDDGLRLDIHRTRRDVIAAFERRATPGVAPDAPAPTANGATGATTADAGRDGS